MDDDTRQATSLSVLTGFVAQHFGIQHTLTVGLFGLVGGLILGFFIRETAPRFTRSTSPAT